VSGRLGSPTSGVTVDVVRRDGIDPARRRRLVKLLAILLDRPSTPDESPKP